MTVPEGIPITFVFLGIFTFLVLFISCVVLSIITKDTDLRAALIGAAVVLLAIMAGGAYFTLTADDDEADGEAEASPTAEAPAPEMPPEPQGAVVLVVDESTITKDGDPLETESLSIEELLLSSSGRPEARAERRRIGQQLASIESTLNERLLALGSQVQLVNQRFDAKEIGNYDALFWQAKLKMQQYGLVVKAMDDKQKLLEGASTITDDERAKDIERIRLRRSHALEKWQEYQGVLSELSSNSEVFHNL